MAIVLCAAGLAYLYDVAAMSIEAGSIAPPASAIPFILLVVLGSIFGQTVLALSAPREANAPADERERLAQGRSATISGVILAAGILIALGTYLLSPDGNLLFHLIFACLIVAQITDYALRIALLRIAG